jgi:hypothetical protein
VVPLGTRVRARVSGWDEVIADSYEASHEKGLDILPTYNGIAEWQQGELAGWPVKVGRSSYFNYLVNGIQVDPDTIVVLPALPAGSDGSTLPS